MRRGYSVSNFFFGQNIFARINTFFIQVFNVSPTIRVGTIQDLRRKAKLIFICSRNRRRILFYISKCSWHVSHQLCNFRWLYLILRNKIINVVDNERCQERIAGLSSFCQDHNSNVRDGGLNAAHGSKEVGLPGETVFYNQNSRILLLTCCQQGINIGYISNRFKCSGIGFPEILH